jgi:lipoprotein-anchoring transpeptidase ErfK/SrfK
MQGQDYDVPDVPYTMYYSGNYAIHGAYWHNQFGTPVSHGCVNVAVDHAEWLFNWTALGTPVIVK